MSNSKLYVGNLTFNATENDLREFFAAAGEVREATIVTDKMTGQSRGFGFVTMADEAGAKTACEKFDNQDFQGRNLTVNVARPREDRPAGGGGGRSFGGGGGGNRGGGGGGDRRPARRY